MLMTSDILEEGGSQHILQRLLLSLRKVFMRHFTDEHRVYPVQCCT